MERKTPVPQKCLNRSEMWLTKTGSKGIKNVVSPVSAFRLRLISYACEEFLHNLCHVRGRKESNRQNESAIKRGAG